MDRGRYVTLGMAAAVLIGGQPLAGRQAPPQRAISVAAASDLQAALPELATSFERETGAKVTPSFGSSGSFFAQIQNGAPFDVFLSADVDYPTRLVAAGLAEKDSLYEYATGRIVLWTRKATGIDVSRGLQVLLDTRVRRIAIANPEYAPYGRAAVAAMQRERVYDAVRGKLVLGENISQAAQLADSGNADVAILAHSLALGPALRTSGTYAEIPVSSHPPIRQAAVIITASRNKSTARAFIDSLKRPDALQILQRFGFNPPQRAP